MRAAFRQFGAPAVLLCLAMLLGGGGVQHPAEELLTEALIAVIGCLWFLKADRFGPRGTPRAAWLVAGALLILPIIQLIPLPPGVWHALPGRDLEVQSLSLVGAQNSWRPWSMTPDLTFASLLTMIPAALILLMVSALPRGGRQLAVGVIAAVALAALMVGTAMRTEAGSFLMIYGKSGNDLTGFNANHNSAADVLLIGMIAFAAWFREWNEQRRRPLPAIYGVGMTAGACLMFGVGVVMTASRAGCALLVVAIAACAIIAWPRKGFVVQAAGLGFIGVGVAAVAGFVVFWHNQAMARIISRFHIDHELRPELWKDTLVAIHQYFPFGSGMGSFVPIYMSFERLEIVSMGVANRAHNDYLELTLEAGVFGWLVVAVVVGILSAALVRNFKAPYGGARGHIVFAVSSLMIVALHSVVDYPLRNISLTIVAACCAALLLGLQEQPGSRPR